MIFRSLFFIFVYVPAMIVLIPTQFVITRLGLFWNVPTMLFHTLGCVFLGLRVKTIGEPLHGRPTLLLSNHISWTDIIAIGSKADVTFVSKAGVRDTFFVGFMASLQKTIFVDYDRRQDTRRTNAEMAKRLASNSAVLLFAEGHRDLGSHVQPFRSALVGAAQAAMKEGGATEVAIQPVAISYTHLQGLPVSRNERAGISGMNARGFRAVVANLLTSGMKDVTIAFGAPIPLETGTDRKVVTKIAEDRVRRMLVALNRGQPVPELAA
ncbi:MAG: 1-acyl-sn-glycerol-3-phosphate acyltransferase [Devosia nanyangense]|uniref:1-acyl-sn-glycerol-3-phosphate acyltransferase n=1 Tax=Devosia nanyangense TaxID=1228055 RepID=A0A933L4C6_9HYPH|nr:1-acyl-sn-glycerol-3-phosphate acyltransferase [Devosia nanyangense]